MDDKDRGFPASLKSIISAAPLKTVFKKIFELLSAGQADCVVFMGDFSDKGDIKGFEACCRYVQTSLQLGAQGQLSNIPTGIVPGNHDIDRKVAANPNVRAKFSPLSAALSAVGLPSIPIDRPLQLPVSSSGSSINVILLNSCWGCGEKMYIPDEFRDAINKAIDDVVGGPDGEAALAAYYNRQMDTPAFSADTLTALIDALLERPIEELPVLVAHHNLLPQRLPRLAPYTELVNGGGLRSSLIELERPVVFLHGHIHEEPIEIIHLPNGYPLAMISAPLVTEGFNVIDVVFSPSHVPISCHIHRYRFDGSGVFKRHPRVQVSLLGRRRRRLIPVLSSVYMKLLERGTSYWSDIQSIAGSVAGSSALSEADLVEMLELLMADSLVEIDNYDLKVGNWIVRAEV